MSPSSANPTFATRVARLHSELSRSGMGLTDMRGAQSLELHLTGTVDHRPRPESSRPGGFEPLEGPIEERLVPRVAPGASRLRYFLDGTQLTFLVWRCGLVPVAATVSAAAILSRDATGRCQVEPGTLRMEHAFLIPRRLPDSRLAELLGRLDERGMTVVDPLARLEDEGDYLAAASDYGYLVERARDSSNDVRKALELELLRSWASDPARIGDDAWIVVDGRLRATVPRAIGLVKQFSNSYLTGTDAETLLGLRPGHRTTAVAATDWWRRTDAVDSEESDLPDPDALTLWYLRLWDATGQDARHALIRLEAGADVRETTRIDEISSWVMAERTPRAMADARWATLLYPIHYLERVLKRCLEADTWGWPGA